VPWGVFAGQQAAGFKECSKKENERILPGKRRPKLQRFCLGVGAALVIHPSSARFYSGELKQGEGFAALCT